MDIIQVTYKDHMYKVGEFVYFVEGTEYIFGYFGKIKSIKPFKNVLNEDDNQYIIEALYTDYGAKLHEPVEKLIGSCYLRPAKESLDGLINNKQDEIKALTEIYKVME